MGHLGLMEQRWSIGVLKGRKRAQDAKDAAGRGPYVCSERREDFTLGGRQCLKTDAGDPSGNKAKDPRE